MVHRIWDITEKEIKKPTNPNSLELYEELDTKAKFIILNGVKDSLIPHLSGKNTTYDMWEALQNMFQNKNKIWVLVLEDNLKSTKMIQGKGVTSYLTRLSQARDDLATIREIVSNSEMEELRDEDLHLNKKASYDGVTLAARMKGKQKDLSKIKCFHYEEFGHYSTSVQGRSREMIRRRGSKLQGIIDEVAWYVDTSASKHMTSSQDVFETQAKEEPKLHMVLEDKSQKELMGSSVVPFRVESG
eukprot:PITA_22014